MDKSEYQYNEIDFSPLLVPDIKFAVRCENEDEARAFVCAMIDNFPLKCENWDKSDARWRNDLDGAYGGRAYYPDINDAEYDNFTCGDVQFARDNGFVIVNFSELIVGQEQIDESDMSIDELLGMKNI